MSTCEYLGYTFKLKLYLSLLFEWEEFNSQTRAANAAAAAKAQEAKCKAALAAAKARQTEIELFKANIWAELEGYQTDFADGSRVSPRLRPKMAPAANHLLWAKLLCLQAKLLSASLQCLRSPLPTAAGAGDQCQWRASKRASTGS